MAKIPAVDFFNALYGEIGEGETLEIRTIYKGNVEQNQCISTGIAAGVARLYNGGDVYFGVALRDGRGGRKANITRITTAWADLDATEGLLDPLERVKCSPIPPSAMVASGKGLHCYWFLDKPLGPVGIPAIEKLNKLIAASLGGDSVHDASRVLRVPGTVNRKYDRPYDVVLLGLEPDRRYSIEQMCVAFRGVESSKSKVESREEAMPQSASCNPHSLPCRREMWGGVAEGARHNAAFQLAIDLKRDGLPGQIAYAALSDWNTRNRPPLEMRQLGETIGSVYSGDYKGLGCDKKPMIDWCDEGCPVKRVESSKSKVESWEDSLPETDDCELTTDDVLLRTDNCLPVWTASELAEMGNDPPDFLVEGLVPARGVTMFTGEGGIGKSFIVLDLSLAVASGEKFLGRFECKDGGVLVVDLENDVQMMARRFRRVSRGRGFAGANVSWVRKDDAGFAHLRVDTDTGRSMLESTIAAHKPRLLVIDPMVAIHGQDENSNVAMRQVMMELDRLSREHELAVVLVHHTRKRGEINDSGQRMRGASDLRNAVVSHVAFKRSGGQSKGCTLISAEQDKCRPAESIRPFSIELSDSEDGEAVYLKYTGEAEGGENVMTKGGLAGDLILEALAEQGECERIDLVAIAEARGIGYRVLERKLTELLSQGLIVKPRRGLYSLAV